MIYRPCREQKEQVGSRSPAPGKAAVILDFLAREQKEQVFPAEGFPRARTRAHAHRKPPGRPCSFCSLCSQTIGCGGNMNNTTEARCAWLATVTLADTRRIYVGL